MQFSITSTPPDKVKAGCVVVGVFEQRLLTSPASVLDAASGNRLTAALQRGDMNGKAGTTLLLSDLAGVLTPRILLVGLGKEKEFSDKEFLNAIRTACKAVGNTGAREATIYLPDAPLKGRDLAWKISQATIAARDVFYRFEEFLSKKGTDTPGLTKIVFPSPSRKDLMAVRQALREGLAVADGMKLARDLGNLPANVCTPSYLADRVVQLGDRFGFATEVLDRPQMADLGMNALLAVANGSQQPPKLIVAHYRGGAPEERPVVLVGKGITFDSGGISLKPGEGMDEMKYDMCGAASVIGALLACADLGLPINLVALVPTCENMPSGGATRPGDIVRSMSGKTIEILNTDAEGRLILCDALTYAERFSPSAVIDVATLTGACVVALGHVTSGLFSNNDRLAGDLIAAADDATDKTWRLPLFDEYQEQLKSNFADIANIGGRPAGAITAAGFLSRFADKFAWAHLDIAGTAWRSGSEKGATGRPVPLLTRFLINRAKHGRESAAA